MKFAKRLQELAEPKYRQFYISYKELKKAIKLITGSDVSSYTIKEVTESFGNIRALGGSIYRPPESRFQDLLNHELDKINKFAGITATAIVGSLRQALKDIRQLMDQHQSGEPPDPSHFIHELESIENAIDSQAEEIVILDAYKSLNFTGFRKITKKYDKNNRSAAASWFMSRLTKEQFMLIDFDYLLSILSVCYSELRRLHAMEASESDPQSRGVSGTVGASAFGEPVGENEIRSVKYWINAESMRVKVKIIKHVPLLAQGGKKLEYPSIQHEVLNPLTQPLQTAFVQPGADLRSFTSYIYFDNETLDSYYEVLDQRQDGRGQPTQIIRFQWQGENDNQPDKDIAMVLQNPFEPAHDALEWPEKVTHEESGLPRCATVKQRHIKSILDGTFDMDAWLGRKRELGMSDVNLTLKKQHIDNIIARLRDKKAKPMVRATFHRSSFRGEHGNIFINLDEEVRFMNEDVPAKDAANWVRASTEARASEEIVGLNFAVLDVSIRGRDGTEWEWLSELTGMAYVTEVWGFSCFIHSMAFLHSKQLGTGRYPHWFKHAVQEEDDREEHESEEQGPSARPTLVEHPQHQVDVIGVGESARLMHENTSFHEMADHINRFASGDRGGASASASGVAHADQSPEALMARPLPPPPPRSVDVGGELSEPLLRGERAAFPPKAARPAAATAAAAGGGGEQRPPRRPTRERDARELHSPARSRWCPDFWTRRRPRIEGRPGGPPGPGGPGVGGGGGGGPRGVPTPQQAAVRVEPKVFFANERTFLQWMNVAVLLSTISITILNLGTSTSFIAGLIMAPVGIFFIIYSYSVYVRRARALERKEPLNYNDQLGPTVLVVTLVVALSAILYVNVTAHLKEAGDFPPLAHTPKHQVKHENHPVAPPPKEAESASAHDEHKNHDKKDKGDKGDNSTSLVQAFGPLRSGVFDKQGDGGVMRETVFRRRMNMNRPAAAAEPGQDEQPVEFV